MARVASIENCVFDDAREISSRSEWRLSGLLRDPTVSFYFLFSPVSLSSATWVVHDDTYDERQDQGMVKSWVARVFAPYPHFGAFARVCRFACQEPSYHNTMSSFMGRDFFGEAGSPPLDVSLPLSHDHGKPCRRSLGRLRSHFSVGPPRIII